MTDTSFAPFSNNPVNNDTLAGVLRLVLRKWTQYLDNQLPAQVIAYDRSTNRAQVQPFIVMVTTLNVQVTRAQIASAPVRMLGAGGVVQSYCPVPGDLGWLHANDRDISLFTQGYKNSPPNSKRFHSFQDAVFEPDPMTGVTINSNFAANAVIQTKDGTSAVGLMTANCLMDMQSTTKAFGLPPMTTAQRDAIPSPRGGLAVYVTDSSPTPHVSFYIEGVGWS